VQEAPPEAQGPEIGQIASSVCKNFTNSLPRFPLRGCDNFRDLIRFIAALRIRFRIIERDGEFIARAVPGCRMARSRFSGSFGWILIDK
jgi:hypothetical protein